MNWTELPARAGSMGIDVTHDHIELLQGLHDLLVAGNKKFNLTRLIDVPDFLTLHVLDSLTILPFIGHNDGLRLIDVGSGGGFPAFVLVIFRPELQVTAVESRNKKAGFIADSARSLGIDDRIHVVTGRAEEIAHDRDHRGQYDFATARALAKFPVMCELTLPFVRVGGELLAFRGSDAEKEAHEARGAVSKLGGNPHMSLEPVRVEGLDNRAIVRVAKDTLTPKMYPRNVGTPAKHPLS